MSCVSNLCILLSTVYHEHHLKGLFTTNINSCKGVSLFQTPFSIPHRRSKFQAKHELCHTCDNMSFECLSLHDKYALFCTSVHFITYPSVKDFYGSTWGLDYLAAVSSLEPLPGSIREETSGLGPFLRDVRFVLASLRLFDPGRMLHL